jgi:hypothetical protein
MILTVRMTIIMKECILKELVFSDGGFDTHAVLKAFTRNPDLERIYTQPKFVERLRSHLLNTGRTHVTVIGVDLEKADEDRWKK